MKYKYEKIEGTIARVKESISLLRSFFFAFCYR